MTGQVTLVGAGPGDPGLLTLAGKEALERADTVIYDRLVGEEILSLLPAGAERIDAGKEPGGHTMPQEEISRLLAEKAEEGKNVVRLKGGDPFLFGRGGEELSLLRERGIPFRVIPGVTSALAAPAYAGIPVTHRDFASSVHIVSGHPGAGKPWRADFPALVQGGGTLVFLMGVGRVEEICAKLLEAGMDPDTPAAAVERGTLPSQRLISATAGTLAKKAREEKLSNPAVLLFGGVCALSETLGWREKLPLGGKRILLTQSAGRGTALAGALRALGAETAEIPCVELSPLPPDPTIEKAVERLGEYAWLAFTSPSGVSFFFSLLGAMGKDARALGGVKLAAVGPGTAKALEERGLIWDGMPEEYDGAHLGSFLARQAGGRVLLVRGKRGSASLPAALTEGGIPFDELAVYETRPVCGDPERLRRTLERGTDAVVFTSASAVEGFLEAAGKGVCLSRVRGVCIGPATAAACRRSGITCMTAEEPTQEGLISCIGKAVWAWN